MKKFVLIFIAALFSLTTIAQRDYSHVDEEMAKEKFVDTLDVVKLAAAIGSKFGTPAEKVRAFYYWISNNIVWDLAGLQDSDELKSEPGEVLKRRKGNSLGYANLFQEMCSANDIRCLKIDGYARSSAFDLMNPVSEINHNWNIVQLGKSPEQWYNIDCFWGAGISDAEFKTFTKRYTKEWFFTDKLVFSYTHLARIEEWRMANKNMSLKAFNKLPVLREGYVKFGGSTFTPSEGVTKVKEGGKFIITITLKKASEIQKVMLRLSDERKAKAEEAVFTTKGNTLTITIPNKEGQEIPVYVFLDDYLTLAYYVNFE
jgi:hypothetical protein